MRNYTPTYQQTADKVEASVYLIGAYRPTRFIADPKQVIRDASRAARARTDLGRLTQCAVALGILKSLA